MFSCSTLSEGLSPTLGAGRDNLAARVELLSRMRVCFIKILERDVPMLVPDCDTFGTDVPASNVCKVFCEVSDVLVRRVEKIWTDGCRDPESSSGDVSVLWTWMCRSGGALG